MKKIFVTLLCVLSFWAGTHYDSFRNSSNSISTQFIDDGKKIVEIVEEEDPYEGITYAEQADPRILSNKFKEGIVPNAKTAYYLAVAVLSSVYGEDNIKKQLPLHIILINDEYWHVTGTLHAGKGGAASINIRKENGTIMGVYHGE